MLFELQSKGIAQDGYDFQGLQVNSHTLDSSTLWYSYCCPLSKKWKLSPLIAPRDLSAVCVDQESNNYACLGSNSYLYRNDEVHDFISWAGHRRKQWRMILNRSLVLHIWWFDQIESRSFLALDYDRNSAQVLDVNKYLSVDAFVLGASTFD